MDAENSHTLSQGLRELTRLLMEDGEESPQGLLGGEHGYGVEYSNEVFEMHPYYWGDCTCGFEEADERWGRAHRHGPSCYQEELAARGVGYDPDTWDSLSPELSFEEEREIAVQLAKERGLDTEVGLRVHCDCGLQDAYRTWRSTHGHTPTCPVERPNFRHHGTGFEVRWYKYVGRSMEVNQQISDTKFEKVLQECSASLGQEASLPGKAALDVGAAE